MHRAADDAPGSRHTSGLQMWWMIDGPSLTCQNCGNKVTRTQLEHLLELSEHPTSNLRAFPPSRGTQARRHRQPNPLRSSPGTCSPGSGPSAPHPGQNTALSCETSDCTR
nr:Scr1 family TA system antitoxin-like transcriptional regulator [Nocardiopsis exhalans]